MWIVFEGPDCSGKSTLADAVHRRLVSHGGGVELVHTGPPSSPAAAFRDCVSGPYARYDGSYSLVSDRWSWGERVYGPMFRPDQDVDGYGALGPGGWRYNELFGAARGAYVVLMLPDPDVIKARMEARRDEMVDTSHVDELHHRYRQVFNDADLTRGETITQSSIEDHEVIAEDIITRASERSAQMQKRWNDGWSAWGTSWSHHLRHWSIGAALPSSSHIQLSVPTSSSRLAERAMLKKNADWKSVVITYSHFTGS